MCLLRKINYFFILLVMILTFGSATAAEPSIVIKFSHAAAIGTPKSLAIEEFKRLAEQRTQGRVRVDVYPNSTLYKDKEELEALQMGAVQMLAPTLSKFGTLGIREFEVFDLPYLFADRAALARITRGPIGQQLFAILEQKGIKGLAYWDNGFKMMSANKPIRVPADMRGLKIRIQGSKVLDEQMRTLGANPQVMSFSEMSQALQSGVVDGAENPPLNFFSQKVFEVQKHLCVTNHGYLGFAVITNKRFWDKLPADIRTALEKSIEDAGRLNDSLIDKESAKAMDAIRKSGKTEIYHPSAAELKLWKDALLPVHKKMESRIGAKLLEQVYKDL
jgi:C4-dicarboxylate-binding protein DctP